MRWEQLFADLEAAFAAERAAVEDLGSRTRAEVGAVRLADRLRGAVGHDVRLDCRGAGPVVGRLADVGTDWLLLTGDRGQDLLVATGCVRAVGGLGAVTAPAAEPGAVARAWDLRRAVRGLARDRAAVRCVLDDGTVLTGTVDRVGADFLELAEHQLDEPRRRGAVRSVRAVVLDAVALLASPGGG
ncbi:hypothetical protein [Klenkia taihuensis]|uniref:Uncharacterized protein n=1 Tax=Klenkia taihuensis TaxID=1225127 RepID=A0A1I1K195_9ACTN|nr:hypothetical protein [Klenkia taihuensis]GHE10562.1 hypothetical protein GCM10011381_20180 [Klenkia taihuensis]SFC54727.1 hypothetical protein SAMN05661030_1263 [Klenkia taihuensis]